MPSLPYGVTTFASIISDAFDVRGAICAVWAWCSRLRRSCGKKGRTADISDDLSDDRLPWRQSLIANLYKDYSWLPQEEEVKEKGAKRKETTKEFVFVDFNAWECAACIHLSLRVLTFHTFCFSGSPNRKRFGQDLYEEYSLRWRRGSPPGSIPA